MRDHLTELEARIDEAMMNVYRPMLDERADAARCNLVLSVLVLGFTAFGGIQL